VNIDLHQFVGNPNHYAVQLPQGGYRPVRAPLTDAVLLDHARGVTTVGTYVVNMDKARFIVWDIDVMDLTLAKEVATRATLRGLTPGIEFSGRKGYHVWALFDEWLPAADLQRLGKDIAAEAGFNGEVFPKQGSVRDLGSLVKLPLGKHAVSGQDSRFIVMPTVTPGEKAREAVAKLPPPVVHTPKAGSGPLPCIDSIQSNPPGVGERNDLYFHFAAHMRRMGLQSDAIEAVLEALWVNPDPGEVAQTVANSEFSGPTCDNVPAARHCGASCIKQRAKGLSLRPGQVKNGMEGELVVVELGQAGGPIREVKHPDIQTGKAALFTKGP
jgi:hypothetical protein